MTKPQLHLSGDPAADRLISNNPFALLVGMVLDQQIPLEWAFTGPKLLRERLGGKLDAKSVASTGETELSSAFSTRPALHRFPSSMARRVHELAHIVVSDYAGDPSRIWQTASSAEELLKRLKKLPGFGEQKAKIFVALLGKQLGVRPDGWQEVSAPYGEPDAKRSIADIESPETLALVRETKKAMKQALVQAQAAGSPPRRPAGKSTATSAGSPPRRPAGKSPRRSANSAR